MGSDNQVGGRTFVDLCVERAQSLFAKAEELGKDGHQFAIAGADLMASAAHQETHFGPKQFSDLVCSVLPLIALLSPKAAPRSETPPEDRKVEPAARDEEIRNARRAYFAAEVLQRFSDKVITGLVDRLVDLNDDYRDGVTAQEMERILREVAPIAFERIERLRKLIDIPPAAFAVAGIDFA